MGSITPMPHEAYESRPVTTLRTGSKIAVLIGVSLIALAIYFFFVPLSVPSQNGGVFGCGTASNPPTSGWGKGACQGIPDEAKYRAILCLVLGILIPALGLALFGVDKRQEHRPVRTAREDFEDNFDDELDDEVGPRTARRATARRDQERDAAGRRRAQTQSEAASRSGRRRSYEDDDIAGDDDFDDAGPVRYRPAPRAER